MRCRGGRSLLGGSPFTFGRECRKISTERKILDEVTLTRGFSKTATLPGRERPPRARAHPAGTLGVGRPGGGVDRAFRPDSRKERRLLRRAHGRAGARGLRGLGAALPRYPRAERRRGGPDPPRDPGREAGGRGGGHGGRGGRVRETGVGFFRSRAPEARLSRLPGGAPRDRDRLGGEGFESELPDGDGSGGGVRQGRGAP